MNYKDDSLLDYPEIKMTEESLKAIKRKTFEKIEQGIYKRSLISEIENGVSAAKIEEVRRNMQYVYGERIEKLRIQKGLKREELSAMCGQNKRYIYQIENGLRGMSVPVMQKLCDILETTPEYLLSTQHDDNSPYKKLMSRCYELPQEDAELILRIVEGMLKKEE